MQTHSSFTKTMTEGNKEFSALSPKLLRIWYALWFFMSFNVALSSQLISLTAHKRHHGGKVIYPDEYLSHLGYMGNSHGYWMHTRSERKKAIRMYQQMYHLKPTGRIDSATWSQMQTPRCGVPDVGPMAVSSGIPDKINNNNNNRRKKRATNKTQRRAVPLDNPVFSKWIVKDVTWKASKFTYNIPWSKQRAIFHKAMQLWSEPTPIKLRNTALEPDIELSFQRRNHGDGISNAFDGRGLLLAHAFPPGDVAISGDVHFDQDELWTTGVNSSKTRDLMQTALHEIGHSLGLRHSRSRDDVMYSNYRDYHPNPTLSVGDIKQLQELYGLDRKFKKKQRKMMRQIRFERMKQRIAAKAKRLAEKRRPRWCRGSFNDVAKGPNGEAFAFIRKQVYQLDNNGIMPGFPKRITHVFVGAPLNPAAVVYLDRKKKTYFFKGRRYWRFTNKTLDEGYPKRIDKPYPEVPLAAITMKERGGEMVYFFGKTKTWRWNEMTEKSTSGVYSIKRYWVGLPPIIDGAVEWYDRYIYFFYRNTYYRVSKYRKVALPGYPKNKGPAWLGGQCGHAAK